MEPVFSRHKTDACRADLVAHPTSAPHRLGTLCAHILLTIFYFTLLVPFGLAVRLLGDPLRLRASNTHSFWVKRETGEPSLKDAHKGY